MAESSSTSGFEGDDDSSSDAARMRIVAIWYPRIAGIITCICSLYMLCMAWKKRNLLFHRLVFGMASHGMLFGICSIIGTFAIPSEYEGFYQNIGTIQTCTLQGFIIYITIRAGMLYYASFSVYSYLGVLNNFDKTKYLWCEKWIHFLVHAVSFAYAFYFLAVEGFNPSIGTCRQVSYPMGCEVSDDTPCERGPSTYGFVAQAFFYVLPLCAFVLLPTGVMIALYCTVKGRERRQREQQPQTTQVDDLCVMKSSQVARQACVYLSVLYWVTLPFFIFRTLYSFVQNDAIYPLRMFGMINYSLCFFWKMLMYRHFSVDGSKSACKKRPVRDSFETPRPTAAQQVETVDFIFNAEDTSERLQKGKKPSLPGTPPGAPATTDMPPSSQTLPIKREYSFNIFDGSNASSHFSQFIFDGDSDDEEADNNESSHWGSVQHLR